MDGRGFGKGAGHPNNSKNFSKIANLKGLRKHFRPENQHAPVIIILINNSDVINNKYFQKNSWKINNNNNN